MSPTACCLATLAVAAALGQRPPAADQPAADPPAADPTAVALVDVFRGGTHGYDTFRIPAVVRVMNGDLVAFAEGRVQGRGDTGDIDLVRSRSRDGGATWSAPVVVWNEAANTCGNPCPVVDRGTGAILLLATHNLGTDREPAIIAGTSTATRTVWLLRSDDHGQTWSAPEEITNAVKPAAWTWYATGPGAGIQLEQGEHRGRLVVPCDHIEAKTKHYDSHVIWSDDHGATWQLGGSSPGHLVNECEVVELASGRLLLNMRNYDRAQKTRQVCSSDDGGASWSDQHHDGALPEPICQASIRRICWPSPASPGLIAFSNPADPDQRRKLTLRISSDEGRTWASSRVLYAGSSAYSCLVALPDLRIGCLFEADDYRRIVFAALPAN